MIEANLLNIGEKKTKQKDKLETRPMHKKKYSKEEGEKKFGDVL